MSKERTRKLVWGLLAAAAAALQIYFVRELLVALLLFSMVFATGVVLAVLFFLVETAGARSFAWAETYLRPVAALARRRLAALEELSRKPSHRPRSEPVP